MEYTEEELAMLTDEEREELELEGKDGDTDDDGQDGGNGKEDPEDGQEGTTDDDEGKDAPKDGGKPDDGANDDDGDAGRDDGADDDKPEVHAPVVPLINGEAPKDAEARLEALAKAEDDADQKLDDGEYTTSEWRAENRRIKAERKEIEDAVLRASLSEDTVRQQEIQSWNNSVREFLGDHGEVTKSQVRFQAFDQIVRAVTGNKENHGLSNRKQLEKAYEVFESEFGLKREDKPAKEEPGKKPKPERNIPPTLAKVPAADLNTDDGGKYAHLDRLMEEDPIAFEEAMAKMSPAEQEAYLESN